MAQILPASPMISTVMDKHLTIQYAQFLPLKDWRPLIGDLVIWHGWFTHWFGFISSIDQNGMLSIIKAGLPALLMQMNQGEYAKNTIKVNMFKMLGSRNGEYAALQCPGGHPEKTVWYI
jgi:hypothetical protein